MKLKEIASKYFVDAKDFISFVKQRDLDYTDVLSIVNIPDEKVEEYVQLYKHEKMNEKKVQIEDEKKKQEMAKMLISSGFSFEGYRITKYSGYISGDDAVQIPRGTANWFSGTNHGENLTKALVQIRRQALKELKEAAHDLGCNAVIGVDFDYITLEPETANYTGGTTYEPYVICVTANGNAVVIEKDSEHRNK